LSFCIGYFLYNISVDNSIVVVNNIKIVKKNKIVSLQFAVIILLIVLTLVNVYLMTGSFLNFSYYRYILTELATKTIINKIMPLLTPVVFVGLPVLIYINASKRTIFLFSFLLAVFFIISGSRSIFIVAILILIWYLYFSNKLKIKHLLFSSIIIIFGFSLLGFLLGKLSLEDAYLDYFFLYVNNDIPRNFFTVSVLSILKYMLGGIVAFSELTNIYEPTYDFNLVLLNLSKLMSFLGISPNITTISYVEIPFRINVYTWYYNAYLDFGYFGIVFTFLILGYIGALLFRNYKHNSIFIIYLCTYYTIMTLSIFHDYWYSSLFPYTILVYLIIIKKLYFIRK
jgi:oligosaccharide repeat unit polymerase